MTGTDHYAEAERLLTEAEGVDPENPDINRRTWQHASALVAAAQVHATLALADATRRVAEDDDRIAGCVPEGGSRLQVSTAGG